MDATNLNSDPAWRRTQQGEFRAGEQAPVHRDRLGQAPGSPQLPESAYVDASLQEELQLGKELGALFKDKQVHPVLIFGSKGSGKTSLIASLFKYMNDRPEAEASIELADELFPDGDQRWDRRRSWARDLFFRKVFDYIDRQAPAATQESEPFFVPVRLTKKSGHGAYFAFLEGKGEWYMPDFSAEVPFKKFKGLLQGVLQSYNDCATVIYVAPYVTESPDEGPTAKGLRQSDVGLLGALNEYAVTRKALFHQDKHIFLMTKWDVCCESIATESFLDPDPQELQDALGQRYQLSWTKYINMTPSTESSNKAYSTYCAGIMDGRSIAAPATDDAARMATYPRRLWDTLYQNATGRILYADVQPKTPSWLDRLLSLLRR